MMATAISAMAAPVAATSETPTAANMAGQAGETTGSVAQGASTDATFSAALSALLASLVLGAQSPAAAVQLAADGAESPAPAEAGQQPVQKDSATDAAAQRMALDCLLQMGFLVAAQPKADDLEAAQAAQLLAITDPLAALQNVAAVSTMPAGVSATVTGSLASGSAAIDSGTVSAQTAKTPQLGIAQPTILAQDQSRQIPYAKAGRGVEVTLPADLSAFPSIPAVQESTHGAVPVDVLAGQRVDLSNLARSNAESKPVAKVDGVDEAQEVVAALYSSHAASNAQAAQATDMAIKTLPVTETVVLDPTSSKTWQDIANRIQITHMQGGTEARIHLWPPELGRIEVRLVVNGQHVGVQLEATTPRAQQILQENVTQLRSALSDQGLDVRTLSVSLGHSTLGQQTMGQQRGWASWNGETPGATPWFDRLSDDRMAPMPIGALVVRSPRTQVDFMA